MRDWYSRIHADAGDARSNARAAERRARRGEDMAEIHATLCYCEEVGACLAKVTLAGVEGADLETRKL